MPLTGPCHDIHNKASLIRYCRLLALELGKPLMIDDDACDTEYPEPVDDQYITNHGVLQDGQSTPLLATIHVVRSVQPLVRLFKSEFISPETILSYEKHLDACHDLFPPPLLLSSKEPLDPRSIAPMIYLQNVRMMLHRHNISPFCRPEARHRAVQACVNIALNTSQLLSRCMGPTSATRYDLAVSATTLLCTHLWRCTLFLLFRAEYEAALVLVQAFFTIGSAKSVTVDCGQHIAFFIKCIIDRFQSGVGGDFEQDEELMAYVSADMQSSAENSWVWQGSETGANLSTKSAVGQDRADTSPGVGGSGWPPFARADLSRISYDRVLVEEAPQDWDGWEQLERSLHYLLEQQRQQRQPRESHPPPSTVPPPPLQPARQQQASPGNSRMTIANII
jgi:hypothetical protein